MGKGGRHKAGRGGGGGGGGGGGHLPQMPPHADATGYVAETADL